MPEPCICGVSAGISESLRWQPYVHLPFEKPAAPTLQETDIFENFCSIHVLACSRWPRCLSRSAAACRKPIRRRSGWPAKAGAFTTASHQARPRVFSGAAHQGASTSLPQIFTH